MIVQAQVIKVDERVQDTRRGPMRFFDFHVLEEDMGIIQLTYLAELGDQCPKVKKRDNVEVYARVSGISVYGNGALTIDQVRSDSFYLSSGDDVEDLDVEQSQEDLEALQELLNS